MQILAGAIAGAVGAAIWAAISYFGNIEIGYIAWGIGGLVGVAVAAAGKNSAHAGVVAVVITIVSILGGKYAAVELGVQEMEAELQALADQQLASANDITDEALQSTLADNIAKQREEGGQEIVWPEVADDDQPAEAYYPADIWKEAGTQLRGKSEEEKAQLREERLEMAKEWADQVSRAMADAAREEGFVASFSPYDFLFFGLAVFTAWGISSREE